MIRSRDVLRPIFVRSGPTLPPRPSYLWHTLHRGPTGLKNSRRPSRIARLRQATRSTPRARSPAVSLPVRPLAIRPAATPAWLRRCSSGSSLVRQRFQHVAILLGRAPTSRQSLPPGHRRFAHHLGQLPPTGRIASGSICCASDRTASSRSGMVFRLQVARASGRCVRNLLSGVSSQCQRVRLGRPLVVAQLAHEQLVADVRGRGSRLVIEPVDRTEHGQIVIGVRLRAVEQFGHVVREAP